jgi:hypothetical protein
LLRVPETDTRGASPMNTNTPSNSKPLPRALLSGTLQPASVAISAMRQLTLLIVLMTSLGLRAASVPYFEDFESYAIGDTAVTNFTEVSTTAWTIVSPSFSGKAYQNAISVFSPGVGMSAGENSSAVVGFPDLATSSFTISTSFRIDTLTLSGADINNTAVIGLTARAADSTPASSGADRYQVSYFLDDDGVGHPTGRLYLQEQNLFFGDSLNELSATALPIVLGDIYTLTLAGTVSGGSLTLTATLTDTTTSSSISVSDTDSSNVLGGSFFGYFNHVRVEDGGTVSLNADFDTFAAEPDLLELTAAVSRKMHGGAGTFDVNLPLTGEPGVECRSSAGAHSLVFTFSNNVTCGSASVTTGTGSVSGSPTFAGKTMTVNLTGVTDVQKITVTLSGVTDTFAQVLADTPVSVNMLIGDTTGNKSVNSSDISQTKSQSGLAVTSTNFREDVTVTGSINSSDISLVKGSSGHGVP